MTNIEEVKNELRYFGLYHLFVGGVLSVIYILLVLLTAGGIVYAAFLYPALLISLGAYMFILHGSRAPLELLVGRYKAIPYGEVGVSLLFSLFIFISSFASTIPVEWVVYSAAANLTIILVSVLLVLRARVLF
jgi:hypothetical protein